MPSPIPPVLTAEILVVLGIILAASSLTFSILVRRWTTQRRLVAMTDWGKQRGFKLDAAAHVADFGPPLDILRQYGGRSGITLDDGRTRIVELWADPPPRPDGRPSVGQVTWRLLLRRIEPSYRPAGLRPAHDRHSFLDLFSLSSFPDTGGTERFILFAADSEAADEFPAHAIGSIIPQDIGVLVHGESLILDFSSRPFDDLEFNRMTAISDQLARKLAEPG